MTTRVVALGDSTSCGEGVGLRVPAQRTWPALLAAAVDGGALVPLAVAGSRVRDVRRHQLPAARAARPAVATLLVGLNDVSRGGFDARAVRADLRAVVRSLLRTGAAVLVGRLHDPCRHLPLPAPLAAHVRARVAAVNAAVDDAARLGAHVLDLATVPALAERRAFAVDRLHPGPAAHAALAAAAADVLRAAGVPVGVPAAVPLPPRAPGLVTTAWWGTRHGAPWLAAHARDVVLPAVATFSPR